MGNSISRGTKKFIHPVLDPLAITTGHMREFLGQIFYPNFHWHLAKKKKSSHFNCADNFLARSHPPWHQTTTRCSPASICTLSRILAMNFCLLTTRGHSLTTLTLALHYTTSTSHWTAFPIIHCTNDTQLISLITQSHTLYKPWTSSLWSPSIVSTYRCPSW